MLTAAGQQPPLGGQPLRAEQVVSAKFSVLNGLFLVLRPRIDELIAGGVGAQAMQSVVHAGPVATTIKIRGANPKATLALKRDIDHVLKGERFVETVGGVRCVPVWSPYFEHRVFDSDAAEV